MPAHGSAGRTIQHTLVRSSSPLVLHGYAGAGQLVARPGTAPHLQAAHSAPAPPMPMAAVPGQGANSHVPQEAQGASLEQSRSRSTLRGAAGPCSPLVQPRSVSADLLTPSGRLIADSIKKSERENEGPIIATSAAGRKPPGSPPSSVATTTTFTPRASMPPCRTRQGLADLMKDAMVEAKRQVLADVDSRVAKFMDDMKANCLEIVTDRVHEEMETVQKHTAALIATYQKELEEHKASVRTSTTTTLSTLEELAKSSNATNLQLQAELERMQGRSESARREAERVAGDLSELRSWCLTRGLAASPTENQEAEGAQPSTSSIGELQEEMRADHMKTKKCISELVCGIEEVAQALATKDQVVNKRIEALQSEIQQLGNSSSKGGATVPGPTPGSRTCSSAAWPLITVKESDVEADSPTLQPASWEQEFAREIVSMRMQLEYLQGDVTELRNLSDRSEGWDSNAQPSTAQPPARDQETSGSIDSGRVEPVAGASDSSTNTLMKGLSDELQLLRSHLDQELKQEREDRLAVDSNTMSQNSALAAATGKLSKELTEAKAEMAEALGLVHEAVRLGDYLKNELEFERQARQVDMKKLTGKMECLDKDALAWKALDKEQLRILAASMPATNGLEPVAVNADASKDGPLDPASCSQQRAPSPPASDSIQRKVMPVPADERLQVPALDLSKTHDLQDSGLESTEGSFVSTSATAVVHGATASTSTTSNGSLAKPEGTSAPPTTPSDQPPSVVPALSVGVPMPSGTIATSGSFSAPLGARVSRAPLASPAPASGISPPQPGTSHSRTSWTPSRVQPNAMTPMTQPGPAGGPQPVTRIPAHVMARDRSPVSVMQMRR